MVCLHTRILESKLHDEDEGRTLSIHRCVPGAWNSVSYIVGAWKVFVEWMNSVAWASNMSPQSQDLKRGIFDLEKRNGTELREDQRQGTNPS